MLSLFTDRYLKEHFRYLDEDKTAIYGKGSGAYLAVSLISRSSHFNCGVAVAPVTSWRNYGIDLWISPPRISGVPNIPLPEWFYSRILPALLEYNPLIHWLSISFLAAAFVEKYMGLPLPQDNYINYDKTDLVRNFGDIEGETVVDCSWNGWSDRFHSTFNAPDESPDG